MSSGGSPSLSPSATGTRLPCLADAPVTNLGAECADMGPPFCIHSLRRLEAVKTTVTEAGVNLPYLTSQGLLHGQAEDTHADRGRQREGWPARDREAPRARLAILEEVRRTDEGRAPHRVAS